MKDYDIYINGVFHSTITTNTKKEAFAYACGMAEGFRFVEAFGNRLELRDKKGKIIYSY